jgi:hypothetical protein
MLFTEQQIAEIHRIVDSKVAHILLREATCSNKAKEYHSAKEVRGLIEKNLPALRKHFGSRDFHIKAFRDFLASKVEMRPGDAESTGLGKAGSRWDKQVSSAIDRSVWPECPVVSANCRAMYRLVSSSAQLSLDNQ